MFVQVTTLPIAVEICTRGGELVTLHMSTHDAKQLSCELSRLLALASAGGQKIRLQIDALAIDAILTTERAEAMRDELASALWPL